jgi:hypothetical protein
VLGGTGLRLDRQGHSSGAGILMLGFSHDCFFPNDCPLDSAGVLWRLSILQSGRGTGSSIIRDLRFLMKVATDSIKKKVACAWYFLAAQEPVMWRRGQVRRRWRF